MVENEKDNAMKQFERCQNSRAVLPHPGPLPLGEGASQSAAEFSERVAREGDGMPFSLSQRERAGVRESATHSQVTIKCVSGRFRPIDA